MKAGQPEIWAVIPVKETSEAKQRLSAGVPQEVRRQLALFMLEDVLAAVSQAHGVAGIAVVTVDAGAEQLARRYGARILTGDARSGHTAAVAAAARWLAAEGVAGMLQLPGDVPLAMPPELSHVLSMHRTAPSFTIVPSHDDRGSNAVVLSPPTVVPLRFGDDSFLPHLAMARQRGIEPLIIRLPGIGRDIDDLEDLAVFARMRSNTRTQSFLDRHGIADGGAQALCAVQRKRPDDC